MWSGSLYLSSENLNILLRSCPNVGSELARMLEMPELDGVGGVQTGFGFSVDAAPTIDMVLYFRG